MRGFLNLRANLLEEAFKELITRLAEYEGVPYCFECWCKQGDDE